jgi:hypothetical protein
LFARYWWRFRTRLRYNEPTRNGLDDLEEAFSKSRSFFNRWTIVITLETTLFTTRISYHQLPSHAGLAISPPTYSRWCTPRHFDSSWQKCSFSYRLKLLVNKTESS